MENLHGIRNEILRKLQYVLLKFKEVLRISRHLGDPRRYAVVIESTGVTDNPNNQTQKVKTDIHGELHYLEPEKNLGKSWEISASLTCLIAEN